MQGETDPQPEVVFGGIYERDVDLVLLVELAASPHFLAWFVAKALGRAVERVSLIRVARGVTSSDGETDLRIEVDVGAELPVCVLVENKIDSGFQPRQAERYAERASREAKMGLWSSVPLVLLAARCYSTTKHAVFHLITYEEAIEAMRKSPSRDARTLVGVAILESAVRKAREGYDRIVDAPTTTFWHEYWKICCNEFSQIHLPKPGGRPSKSGFVRFTAPEIGLRIQLIHKLVQGRVDLQLSNRHPADLQGQIIHRLEGGMRLHKAGKSSAVRLEVPRCNPGIPIADQVERVRAGLLAARRLYEWAVVHAGALRGE